MISVKSKKRDTKSKTIDGKLDDISIFWHKNDHIAYFFSDDEIGELIKKAKKEKISLREYIRSILYK